MISHPRSEHSDPQHLSARVNCDEIDSIGLWRGANLSSPLDRYNGILPFLEGNSGVDESSYFSGVGSLGYAANGTRPDISFATSQHGSYNSS